MDAARTHQLDAVVAARRIVIYDLNDLMGRLAAIWTKEIRFVWHRALRGEDLQIDAAVCSAAAPICV
jgi:hypothetical protein